MCEKCHLQLNNACPQCRSGYVGTRNYLLEEVIKHLKHLKCGQDEGGAETSSANKSENCDAKLTTAIAELVASIPKMSSSEAENEAPTAPVTRAVTIGNSTESLGLTLPEIIRDRFIGNSLIYFTKICRKIIWKCN